MRAPGTLRAPTRVKKAMSKVADLVVTRPDLSDREIASRTGVSYSTVRRVRQGASGGATTDANRIAKEAAGEPPRTTDHAALTNGGSVFSLGQRRPTWQDALDGAFEHRKRDPEAYRQLLRMSASVLDLGEPVGPIHLYGPDGAQALYPPG
jgi:hypothetical protein